MVWSESAASLKIANERLHDKSKFIVHNDLMHNDLWVLLCIIFVSEITIYNIPKWFNSYTLG